MTYQHEQHSRPFWRENLWKAAKVLLALILVGIVIAQTNLKDLAALWQSASLGWMSVSAAAFIGILLVMARRYWLLIDCQVPFHNTLGLVIIQTVLGIFVASSVGLVSYTTLLRSRYQIRVSQSIASLLIARLIDLLVLLTAFALVSMAIWARITPIHGVVFSMLLALGVITTTLTFIFLLRQRVLTIIESLLIFIRLDRLSLCRHIFEQLQKAVQLLGNLWSYTPAVTGYSLLLFFFQFGFTYSYARMVNIPLDSAGLLFVMVFNLLIGMVPIQVFGGLGINELSTLYLYRLLGVEASIAAAAAVSLRLFLVILNLIILLYLPFEARSASKLTSVAQKQEHNHI